MAIKDVHLTSEMITLGQFLKFAGLIDTGGQTKWFLETHEIKVNGDPENRRGKKLYPGDVVEIKGFGTYNVKREEA
jgi:ribosome-associated protein